MKEKTIFEKIVDREIPADIIYEDKKHIVILDIAPFEKGHILVIPKKAYETIFDIPQSEYLELQKIVHMYAIRLNKEIGGGLNILQNNLKIASQEVPHIHIHLIPRKESKKLYCDGKEKYNESEREEVLKRLSNI